MDRERRARWAARYRRQSGRWLVRVRRTVPPGLRLVLGLVLMLGGVFGFLPVVGFWMIPLGVAVAALDIRPLWRRFRRPTPRHANPPDDPPGPSSL